MPCPHIDEKDLIPVVLDISAMERGFDVVVVANIVLFTALLSLKKSHVINARISHVLGTGGQLRPDLVYRVKGLQPGHFNRPINLPPSVMVRMQQYVPYLRGRYTDFSPNFPLFPFHRGAKYPDNKLTKHIRAVLDPLQTRYGWQESMTLGKIRKSGICHYYQWLKRNHRGQPPAMYFAETANFNGNTSRTIQTQITGCTQPRGRGCHIYSQGP